MIQTMITRSQELEKAQTWQRPHWPFITVTADDNPAGAVRHMYETHTRHMLAQLYDATSIEA